MAAHTLISIVLDVKPTERTAATRNMLASVLSVGPRAAIAPSAVFAVNTDCLIHRPRRHHNHERMAGARNTIVNNNPSKKSPPDVVSQVSPDARDATTIAHAMSHAAKYHWLQHDLTPLPLEI